MRSGCLVLCYHSVSGAWQDSIDVEPQILERQVKQLLARGYRAVSAEDTLADRSRTLHVTFDDAFSSVAKVLDTLQRLRVPVTIFACSGLAEDGGHFRVSELRDRLPANEDALQTMPWDVLRELAERGVEIGSHTISHPHLPELGQAELLAELRDSRERIEDELHRPCRFLAYPYGHHDARVRAATRTAGYRGAFTLGSPTVPFEHRAVPRVGVYRGDGSLRLMLKTSRLRRRVIAARPGLRSKWAGGAGPSAQPESSNSRTSADQRAPTDERP